MVEAIDTSVSIVILQYAPWLQYGGLGVARTVGRLGVRVYWVHGQPRAPIGALSRHVYEKVFCDVNAPAEDSVECLLELGQRIGHKSVLIPVDDVAAIFIADQAEALGRSFLFPNQPVGLARSLSSKKEMHFLCKEMGVPTPEVTFPRFTEDVEAFAETATFPMLLKRIAGWLPAHHAQMKSVSILNSREELLAEYGNIGKPVESNVMLQEYIGDDTDPLWVFHGFFAEDSECLAGFTGKKIRQWPPSGGTTTLGVCSKNETLAEMAEGFMRKIGYSGIVDLEYKYDRRDGHYKLLDVNPRIGAQFRLFVDSNKMDVVRALYLYHTGQSVPRGVPREGRKWIVEQNDVITSVHYARLRKLTFTEWARSLRGIEEGAWFARDDLRPFVAMCLALLATVGRKLRRDLQNRVKGAPVLREVVAAVGRRRIPDGVWKAGRKR